MPRYNIWLVLFAQNHDVIAALIVKMDDKTYVLTRFGMDNDIWGYYTCGAIWMPAGVGHLRCYRRWTIQRTHTWWYVCNCCGFEYVTHILPCRINVLPVDTVVDSLLATLRLVLKSGTCTVALTANRTAANCVLNSRKIQRGIKFCGLQTNRTMTKFESLPNYVLAMHLYYFLTSYT